MVKVQKANGVRLLKGIENSKKAQEFISYLGRSVRKKLSSLLSSSNTFASLSDGSQARKTGSEKELVYFRMVRGGIPVCYAAALQDVDSYGDATAENIKRSIDSTFLNKLDCKPER
jgi:hypothetical protein